MKTYRVDKNEFERVLHGNHGIKIQQPLVTHEWVLFLCTDFLAYSQPVQAKVQKIYGSTFKTYSVEGVSEFPFPIEE